MVRSALMALAIAGQLAGTACSKHDGRGDTAPSEPARAAERPGLVRDQPLPPLARDLLRKHMMEHGESMENLLWSAIMLDHDTTRTVAQWILDEPRMSRPAPAAGETINDALPPQFFELQDRMREAAEKLRNAALARDDLGTARAYAELAETCVTCHSVYLNLPGEEGP